MSIAILDNDDCHCKTRYQDSRWNVSQDVAHEVRQGVELRAEYNTNHSYMVGFRELCLLFIRPPFNSRTFGPLPMSTDYAQTHPARPQTNIFTFADDPVPRLDAKRVTFSESAIACAVK